jgi:hypothetical protein
VCRVLTVSPPLVSRPTATALEGVSTIKGEGVAATSISCKRQLCDGDTDQCGNGNHGVCLFKYNTVAM